MATGAACIVLDKAGDGIGVNTMSNIDYRTMSDKELIDRLEKGEMQSNSDLYAEFIRRTEERGTSYDNTPEDEERWEADMAESVRRGLR